ncbi:MAG: winged helix-turn-helix transcriptional regulator, partial [Clostridia bacterium]|nr:winged helix-turn-helix transcriptional regulator [Clostridia bacterium]
IRLDGVSFTYQDHRPNSSSRQILSHLTFDFRSNVENTNCLEFGNLKLDLGTGEISSQNKKMAINGKELDLLEMLMINKSQIVTRELLTDKIWGYDSNAEYNTIEVYISFLRKKLKLLNSNVKIKTVRGIGYKVEVENDS